MAFSQLIKEQVLISCKRHCCLCEKFKGLKIEIHHIKQTFEGGPNTFENAIPLCFDCHGDMRSYDHKHPKGTNYTQKELIRRRDDWYLLAKKLPVQGSSTREYIEFYNHFINYITKELFLQHWPNISDNLIANAIEADVIEGYNNFAMKVFKTKFPGQIIELEEAIKTLETHTSKLANHFQRSNFAYLEDNQKFWYRDMRWKKTRLPQEEYDREYALADDWREELFVLHQNVVVALNKFSDEVRTYINPEYFMREQFSLLDSLGTYNEMQPYEMVPKEFKDYESSIKNG